MPLKPVDWNVVVVGRWNRAILTPSGIITKLFGQPEGTDFQIEVPGDGIGPYRVVYNDLVVIADWVRLTIEATSCDYAALSKARDIAHRALVELPLTPVTAAGYNVRFRVPDDSPPESLLEATRHDWDSGLVEMGFSVDQRALSRTIQWDAGRILVGLTRGGDSPATLAFNFERSGTREQLCEWLAKDVHKIEKQIKAISERVLQLKPEDFP